MCLISFIMIRQCEIKLDIRKGNEGHNSTE